MNKLLLYLFLFYVFAWSFFSYKIFDVPPALNGDEAVIAYNAVLLSQTLRDENNRLLPLFVSASEGDDWKQPVTMYSTALAFFLFGPSYELLRQISIVFILISSFFLFLLLREMGGLRIAAVGLIVFLTTPAILIQSHLALENIAPLPFVSAWLFMLIKYQSTKKAIFALLCGISLGISIYSYQAMRLFVPVFASLSMIYLVYLNLPFKKRSFFFPCFAFILGIFPFILLMLFIRNQYPGALTAYNRTIDVSSYQSFFLPYISSYDFSFMFLKGDSTLYHSTGKHGIYLLASLPLFLIGCYQAISKKKSIMVFILVSLFLAPALFGLVGSVHRGSRLLAMVPLYTVITSLGFTALWEFKTRIIKVIAVGVAVLLLSFNYYDFLNDYWFYYPDRAREFFTSPSHVIFKDLSRYSQESGKTPVVRRDIFRRESRSAKFFEQVYFPSSLKTWEPGEQLTENSVLLNYSSDLPRLEKFGFKQTILEIPLYSLFTK